VIPPTTGGSFRSDQGLARLIEEITARRQDGVPIDVERCAADYPEHADQLRQLLPTLDLLAGVSDDGFGKSESGRSADGLLGVLGDYRIVREVGRGGMGVVYEAEQLSLGRRVALKVLPFAATLDPGQLQRFRNEARAAAGLHHEHVVPVYAVGCERGVHYYAMQFIDGDTLARLVPGPGRPPADYRNVARLLAEAADALDYAHRLGVVHRDVKPANLMVDAAGKLWVTDFGLARFGPDAGLTGPCGVVGTLRYMPPEQAHVRHGLVDHRADVYGLGATLYELLTGRPAFVESDRVEVLLAIAAKDPAPPRRFDRAVPAGLETVALKCLSKDPADRYATAGELADDLRRWLYGMPVLARPPSARQRAVRWAWRHRNAVAAAVVVLVLAAVGTAVASVVTMRAREAAARQEHRADANWRKAFEALDRVCLRVAEDRLPRQARPTPADRALVSQLLAFYEDFVRENGSDPAVRYEAARACLRVGDLCQRLDRPSEAAQAYRQAVARSRALADEFPDDPRYRRALAGGLAQCAAIDVLGVIAERPGRYVDAENAAREAVALRVGLGGRRELARAHDLFGLVLAALYRSAEAEAAHMRALAIHEELVGAAPDDRGRRADLAACCVNLAVLRWSGHRTDEAAPYGAPYARRAVGLWDKLVEEFPREPYYRRWLAKSCVIMCAIGLDGAEGERLGRRAVQIHGELVEEFPGVPTHRYELATAWHWLGWSRKNTKRGTDAAAAYREALALFDRLAADYPDRPDYPGSAGDALVSLSQMARDRGDMPEGIRLWEEAKKRYRAAHDIDPYADRYREKVRREFSSAAGPSDAPPD
jgi:tetratricopeptide (TPR) repeat protein